VRDYNAHVLFHTLWFILYSDVTLEVTCGSPFGPESALLRNASLTVTPTLQEIPQLLLTTILLIFGALYYVNYP